MTYTIRILILTLLVNGSFGVIYYLNESEYNRMPPIYKLDDYNSCLQKPNDVYCSVDFHLVSDEPSDLLTLIENYSEHFVSHYNHSLLRYGICVTKACQNYIQDKVEVSEATLEGCLNQSIWESYQLKTRVDNFKCYNLFDDIKIDSGDVIVGIIILTIILLNIIGSLYDVYFNSRKHEGNSILLLFSIKRNWKTLTSATSSDPKIERLKCINGIRCILMFGIIAIHCLIVFALAAENTHDMELLYHSLSYHMLLSGSLLLQPYFVLTGFLLAYNLEIYFERHEANWGEVPKRIISTYFRSMPVYLLNIALVATWHKFLGPGPSWEITCEVSMSDCRSRWWLNVLLLNNYVYNTQCMIHGWHLAANMQLIILGATVCVLIKKTGLEKTILMTLFTISVVIHAVHTYVRDLNGVSFFIISDIYTLFKNDPTINEAHQMAHTNLSSFIIGLALAYIVYNKQRETDERKNDVTHMQKLKYLYWSVLPLISALIMSGAVFYRDAPRDPLYIRVLYSAFAKPIAGALSAILIAGSIFKWENYYRKVFEWKFWNVPSKLAYNVYVVHVPLIRIYAGLQTSLIYFSTYNLMALIVKVTIASLIAAVPLFLLVETPFTELSKRITSRRVNHKNVTKPRFLEKINHQD